MEFKLFVFIIGMYAIILKAQYPYSEAPEKWSTPKEVGVFRENNYSINQPCVSTDGQYIYYEGIGFIEKIDDGWTKPKLLGDHISRNLARKPCISPNGRRLFFTWWIGGWQLYYSDWDDEVNDWSVPVNCGSTLNNDLGGPYAQCMPNDTTLILSYGPMTYISHWDPKISLWQYPSEFAAKNLGLSSSFGTWVSPTFDRVYSTFFEFDTTLDGEDYSNYYIDVKYRDITSPVVYPHPLILNFCFESDSLYLMGLYEGRYEAWPTLTADGKTIYFLADYHGRITLYESYMIIDENGDSVKTEVKTPEPDTSKNGIPEIYVLKYPYPNPFNTTVTIEYELPVDDTIKLSIYDLNGNLISKIREGHVSAGYYFEKFNGKQKASGLYFVVLNSKRYGIQIKKILLLK